MHKSVWEDVVGSQATGSLTENGEFLLNPCMASELKIGGSLFSHKDIHKWTWHSPDQCTANQIDDFCVSRRWTSSLRDVSLQRC